MVLDTRETRSVELVTTVAGQRFVETRPLAAGENRVEWTVTVPDPELWWPRALGAQPLHDVTVEVRTDGRVADTRTWRVGFRSVQLRDWVFHVNGERLFVKGSNLGPTRMALGGRHARGAATRRRPGGGRRPRHAPGARPRHPAASCTTRPTRPGLLLWQDFPLQWGYARTVRRQARRQAREMVDLLGHHPSVVVWCGHNEPLALDIDADAIADPAKMRRVALRGAAAMLLPTWNKTVLDHSIKKVLDRNDPSRPAIVHSGILPHPPQFDGTDTHLYLGWYHGEARPLRDGHAALAPARPLRVRVRRPGRARRRRVLRARALARPRLGPPRRTGTRSRRRASTCTSPRPSYATFDEWRDATQAYQADVIRRHVEVLRRLKYRPTGGFLQFCFTDAHPAVTWSVLDHQRTPKAGLAALTAACAPVIVVADAPARPRPPGRRPRPRRARGQRPAGPALRVDWSTGRLDWGAGTYEWQWQGDVPADGCVRVATPQFVVPDDAARSSPWPSTTSAATVRARNIYTSLVAHHAPH